MWPTVWSDTGYPSSHHPVMAPAGVLASQANHQILELWTGARPARRAALLGAVEFFGHQSAIPGENGIGFGEARDLSFAP